MIRATCGGGGRAVFVGGGWGGARKSGMMVVALPEMLYSADMARSVTFNASPIVLAAALYLVMLWPVVRLVSRMERRMAS